MNKKRSLQTIGLATKRGAGERGRYLKECFCVCRRECPFPAEISSSLSRID